MLFRSAGFVWSVIERKWPDFEAAFLGFEPRRLLFQPAEFWDSLASDKRIVRNPQKIRSVRDNARFVSDIAAEHGSFGRFLGEWPADDQVGLLDLLAKRGARLYICGLHDQPRSLFERSGFANALGPQSMVERFEVALSLAAA